MTCPSCRSPLAPDSVYCHQCGVRVGLGPDGGRSLFQRPAVVSILAVLDMVGGGAGLIAGLAMVAVGGGAIGGAILGALGALSLACGVGLWLLRRWGRVLQMVLAAVGLLGVPFGTVVSILVLVYLTRPGVKILFSERPPTALTSTEIGEVARVRHYAAPAAAAILGVFVIGMIGILAAIAIPLYANVATRARVAKAQADVRFMASAVGAYAAHCGGPPPVAGVGATCEAAPDGAAVGEVPTAITLVQTNREGRTAGPFMASIPTPPAGWTPYRYVVHGQSFLFCATGDGTTVTSDLEGRCL